MKPSQNTQEQQKQLNVLSLFSGCGGMDLGFEGNFIVNSKSHNPRVNDDWSVEYIDNNKVKLPKTRFKTVFANDIRSDARTAWTSYFSKHGLEKSTYCLDSIVDLVKLHTDSKIKVFPDDVDVVTGGFPCQDFSVAGKRQGFNSSKSHKGVALCEETANEENRGLLYIWMKKVIEITKPKVFIAENVKGLANLKDVKEVIENDFSQAGGDGYLVVPARVLLAANYGVPQSRERVIFIGLKKSALKPNIKDLLSMPEIPIELDPYPLITHTKDGLSGTLPFVNLGDILSDLPEPEESKDIDQQRYSKAKFMGKHCQGQTEIKLDSIGPTIRAEHHGNIEFRRLSTANGGRYLDELESGKKERRLTIRECARIQTFPDDYEFIQKGEADYKNVTASDAYKLIGNAVPPLLGYHIAMRLQSLWSVYFKDS
ncbi:DNA (cytosine-5-)-methyltransferase [Aliidiomarina taiwanensis]|uniref:Cytosine-specific methyltransferase n=2 Tax=Aliidiomarina taiwanensis TaxID=946228 RepID=A0A432X188_9GAMM|nr:DNA (cytosine-5-)-methyltransferase [Aliidiomarina taiwanensis]